MTYFMKLRWQDDRFIRSDSIDPENNYITLYGTDSDWTKLWLPDIFMVNEIPAGIFDVVPTDFIRIYENGTLTISRRHVALFYCSIRLFKVPMTDEICPIQFQSNSYTVDEMELFWFEGISIVYSDDFFSMNSKVTRTETSKCSGGASMAKERRPCLKLELNIHQVYKGFVLQVYLPGGAIVIMLWLGFFIHLNEVSARVRVVSIGFTAMITQMVGVMIVFPDTVQLQPLLVWNIFCLCMNLLAFIEFIVVHNMYITRERWKKQNKEIKVSRPRMTQIQPVNDDTEDSKAQTKRSPYCITPYRMDKICMVLFILTFIIFNVVYWSTFMLV
ncbi:unnamed protein product [Mytilus edulis]|uniref:Uncharacterized protein n=1 Tax=Mytilus edulis TaxID=6550 RepID=A0A8S3V1E4_MYTED|nr:unnamed protein product [Mytilus edulis]